MSRRLAAALALLAVASFAAPAAAHASLITAMPADGALLPAAPREVVLRFTEPVSTALGAVRVLAPSGGRVETGRVASRDGRREVVTSLPANLAEGTYVVTWRVVSADSHPVAGATTFSVGRETPVAAYAGTSAGGLAGRLLAVARLATFAGVVLLAGGAVFVGLLWRRGRDVPVVRRLLWSGWTLATGGTLAALLLHGPYAAGLPLTDALDPTLLRSVAGTRFGTTALARLLLLALAAWLVARHARWPRGGTLAALALGAGVLLSMSSAGHPAAGSLAAVAVPLDAVHFAAVATWLGGLALLAVALLRRGEPDELADVLPRWSRLATVAVVVLVGTGLFAAWREVREAPALPGTTYGRLLLTKTGLVLAMLAAAAYARRLVRRRAATSGAALPLLRRTVVFEAATAAVVLAVTSALVETTPARDAYAPPFVASQPVAAFTVHVDVRPARIGVNAVVLHYEAGDPAEVTARFTHAATGDAVPLRLTRDGPGAYSAPRVALPAKGAWRLDLVTRTSDIDAHSTRFIVRIR